MQRKICSKCKIEKDQSEFYKDRSSKDGLHNRCKLCRKEYDRNRYIENRDKITERVREHQQKNRDKVLEQKREYYHKNRDKKAEYDKKYRQKNQDKIAEYNKKYQQENKDIVNAVAARRRAKKRNAPDDGTWTAELEKLIRNQPCTVCGTTKNIELDHIQALDLGGSHSALNCMPLCRSCNSSKNSKSVEDWLGSMETMQALIVAREIFYIRDGKWNQDSLQN